MTLESNFIYMYGNDGVCMYVVVVVGWCVCVYIYMLIIRPLVRHSISSPPAGALNCHDSLKKKER
jgi:hypothetical protein